MQYASCDGVLVGSGTIIDEGPGFISAPYIPTSWPHLIQAGNLENTSQSPTHKSIRFRVEIAIPSHWYFTNCFPGKRIHSACSSSRCINLLSLCWAVNEGHCRRILGCWTSCRRSGGCGRTWATSPGGNTRRRSSFCRHVQFKLPS
jgi:hypothetical protein